MEAILNSAVNRLAIFNGKTGHAFSREVIVRYDKIDFRAGDCRPFLLLRCIILSMNVSENSAASSPTAYAMAGTACLMGGSAVFTDPVTECARTVFKVQSVYPWQRLVIANILDAVHTAAVETAAVETAAVHAAASPADTGDSVTEPCSSRYDEDGLLRGRQIVLLPTGAGKSLCFLLPALLLDKPTLIVYPLLALMSDQIRRLHECGIEPAVFRGGQTDAERAAQYSRLEGADGKPPAKLIIANPEILLQNAVLTRIAARGIDHLAIDEAHCVSEWGNTFRPAYKHLKTVIRILQPAAVTGFTATAGSEVLHEISRILFDGKAHVVRGEADRANISYRAVHCRVKMPALLAEVKRSTRPLVIFCAARSAAEQTAAFLRYTLHDSRIRFYHAGLQRDEKQAVEQWFHGHDHAVLVTTCAWGMGVDKSNIRTVIHLNPPPSMEAYAQETGRGGRDGKPAAAVLLWSPQDSMRIAALPQTQRERARTLAVFAESGRCRRAVLLEALGDTAACSPYENRQPLCSGCDVCSGTAVLHPQDEAALIRFIKDRKRMYTREELIEYLENTVTGWRAADINNLIFMLLEERKLYTTRNIFWKRTLSCRTS